MRARIKSNARRVGPGYPLKGFDERDVKFGTIGIGLSRRFQWIVCRNCRHELLFAVFGYDNICIDVRSHRSRADAERRPRQEAGAVPTPSARHKVEVDEDESCPVVTIGQQHHQCVPSAISARRTNLPWRPAIQRLV
jgi:hypothetical protein